MFVKEIATSKCFEIVKGLKNETVLRNNEGDVEISNSDWRLILSNQHGSYTQITEQEYFDYMYSQA